MKCVQTRNNFKAQELDCNAGNSGWIPGSGRSPWGKTGYPVQHSCLENSMDRGFWWAIVLESQSVGRDWGINTHFFSKPFSMWINKLSHTILNSLALSFLIVQLLHPYLTTGKTIALTRWTFVGKVNKKAYCFSICYLGWS